MLSLEKMKYFPGEDVGADFFSIQLSEITYQVYLEEELAEVGQQEPTYETMIFRCDRLNKQPVSFALKKPASHQYAFEALAILLNCLFHRQLQGVHLLGLESLGLLLNDFHRTYVDSVTQGK